MALVVMTACVNDPEPSDWSLSVGDKCPDFTVEMNDGTLFDSRTLTDEFTVITLFNTECPDCQRELPVVQKLYEESLGKSISFVCISREEDASSVSAYWQERGLTLPYSAQTDRTIYSMFAASGIPRTYIVNKQGIIVATELSYISDTSK